MAHFVVGSVNVEFGNTHTNAVGVEGIQPLQHI